MEEKQLMVKSLAVNYKTTGQGKPLLILHGWGSSSDKWQAVADLLAQKNMQTIILDLPGFGKSQEPKESWGLDNYVELVKEFSEKLPELEHGFYLAGHSFGGAIAAKFAIKYNQSVVKLFLISAACVRKRTHIKKIFYRIAKISKLFSFLPLYPKARKAFYKFIIRKSDYPYQSGIMKETYLKVILDDLSYKVCFVKVPTVIIWGDKDISTPIDQAYFIHKKITNSKLEVIVGADHLLHVKVPEIVAQKVLAHI